MSQQNSKQEEKWDYLIIKYEHGNGWTVVKKIQVCLEEQRMTQ